MKPRLQSLIYEVTARCNHACLHCYNIWAAPTPSPALPHLENTNRGGCLSPLSRFGGMGELDTAGSLALLTKALDEVDCPHVTLTGGEPLLRADLPQIVDFLHQRGVGCTIISNGRLLSEEKVIDLLARGVGLFELPLLSHRRRMHDRLSGAPGAFDAVLAAMANIRYHGGQFVAVFVATRLNLPDLYDTLRLAFAFGSRGVMFNRFNAGGRGIAHASELLPEVEELRSALAVAEQVSVDLGLPISCSIPIQPCLIDITAFPHLSFGYCAAGTDRAYYTLDPTGSLRPCNHTSTVLGSLSDETFPELITPERMAGFCQAVPAFCQPCSRSETCQGGCKAAAQVCFGSLTAEDPFLRYNQAAAHPFIS